MLEIERDCHRKEFHKKKKFLATLMAVMTAITIPMVSNAEELSEIPVSVENSTNIEQQENVEQAYNSEGELARTSRSRTVTDSHGNRYAVTGTTLRSGTTATTATAFKTSYYYTGQNATTVNNYAKSCQANLSVNLQGGGANSHNKSQTLKGATGECKDTQSYYYMVTYAVGNHYFNCQGGSVSFQSAE